MATDRTERLLNLVICLLGARRPVSRAALREGIAPAAGGYTVRYTRACTIVTSAAHAVTIDPDPSPSVSGAAEGCESVTVSACIMSRAMAMISPSNFVALGHTSRWRALTWA